MRERILVVGGAGYIGSHTAKLLKARGYQPVILDDLSTGHKKAVDVLDVSFHKGDYADVAFVERVLREEKIHTVMHFGAKALVQESVENPLLYYRANVAGSIELLWAMRSAGVKYFVCSSTCSTFGDSKVSPIHERVEQKPVNPYGASKLMLENVLRGLEGRKEIHSVILRYFNAAGADSEGRLGEDHTPETHLIPRAVCALLERGDGLFIHGDDYPTPDGSCVRDYVHVEDLAEAHLLAMEKMWSLGRGDDYNLGSEKGHSVLEVIRELEKVSGRKVPHKIGPRRPGDPPLLVADSRKARENLSWRPKHTLTSVLKTTYEWMKAHPKGYGE